MIVIKYKKKTAGVELIEARLKEMVLGHKMEQFDNSTEIVLTEGSETIIGYTAIHNYLDTLQGELKKWWYCDC